YKDGWWASDHLYYTWEPNGEAPGTETRSPDYNLYPWELYNLNEDYSQADNLAEKYPEKLKELQQLFDVEAQRNQVYPLLATAGSLPTPQIGKNTFTYREGVERLPGMVAPKLSGRAYTLTADVEIPKEGASGAIFAEGSRYGGVTLFVKDS